MKIYTSVAVLCPNALWPAHMVFLGSIHLGEEDSWGHWWATQFLIIFLPFLLTFSPLIRVSKKCMEPCGTSAPSRIRQSAGRLAPQCLALGTLSKRMNTKRRRTRQEGASYHAAAQSSVWKVGRPTSTGALEAAEENKKGSFEHRLDSAIGRRNLISPVVCSTNGVAERRAGETAPGGCPASSMHRRGRLYTVALCLRLRAEPAHERWQLGELRSRTERALRWHAHSAAAGADTHLTWDGQSAGAGSAQGRGSCAVTMNRGIEAISGACCGEERVWRVEIRLTPSVPKASFFWDSSQVEDLRVRGRMCTFYSSSKLQADL